MSGLPPGFYDPYAPQQQPTTGLPPGFYAPGPAAESQPPPLNPTKPVSSDPSLTGQGLTALGEVLKGPVLTSTVRGLGNLANAAWDPYGTIYAPIRKMISPEEEARYQKAEPPGPGTKLGDAFFRWTGIPEYQPTSAPERMLMAGAEGAVAGAPFGQTLIGAISGTGGQAVREAGGGERLATAAELVPGLFMSGREARRQGPAVPNAPELKAAGKAQLESFANAPVELSPAPMAGMAAAAEPTLLRGGFRPRTAPDTFDMLGDLRKQPDAAGWALGTPGPGGNAYTMRDLQAVRESLQSTIEGSRKPTAANPKDFPASVDVLKRLDNIIEDMPNTPLHLRAGTDLDAAAAVNNFRTGRANYLAANNVNRLTGDLDKHVSGVIEQAENRAAAAKSGANLPNTLRGKLATCRTHEPNMVGLSDESIAALDRVIKGGPFSNAVRTGANLLGGGRGLGGWLTGWTSAAPALWSGRYGMGTALALGPPAIGMGLKALENRLTRGRLDTALDTIAKDSPLYRERAANYSGPDYWSIARPSIPGLLADQPDRRWPY